MSLYALTSQAEDDLFAIWSYIARDSIEAADRVESEVYAACNFLAANRHAGHIRPDLTALPVRFWTLPRFRSFIIVYDSGSEPIRIVRILHGALDIPRRLKIGK